MDVMRFETDLFVVRLEVHTHTVTLYNKKQHSDEGQEAYRDLRGAWYRYYQLERRANHYPESDRLDRTHRRTR